ncbi:serine protease inhibitor Cvsi-2-like [Mya arenaria]|uniref:serine protease inhibitor Cvsi-2-like n=1 Tax=Mya arenaria TaxID=6604 RepID=UPI0022E1FC50|nr:serine protease inhibitor Cvsi-2-like [Mya arenaria]
MKIVILIYTAVLVYIVHSEPCNVSTDCVGTKCVSTEAHVHIACNAKHCTCERDAINCLAIADCPGGGANNSTCINGDGRTARWHCLDNVCKCLRV